MTVQQKPLTASAGTNTITLMIPPGATLKKVNAINETKAWQNTSISIYENPDAVGRSLSLLHKVSQAGDRDVSWEGEMLIETPWIYLVATFYGADADDALWLTVSYEMPTREPRRWW